MWVVGDLLLKVGKQWRCYLDLPRLEGVNIGSGSFVCATVVSFESKEWKWDWFVDLPMLTEISIHDNSLKGLDQQDRFKQLLGCYNLFSLSSSDSQFSSL